MEWAFSNSASTRSSQSQHHIPQINDRVPQFLPFQMPSLWLTVCKPGVPIILTSDLRICHNCSPDSELHFIFIWLIYCKWCRWRSQWRWRGSEQVLYTWTWGIPYSQHITVFPTLEASKMYNFRDFFWSHQDWINHWPMVINSINPQYLPVR